MWIQGLKEETKRLILMISELVFDFSDWIAHYFGRIEGVYP